MLVRTFAALRLWRRRLHHRRSVHVLGEQISACAGHENHGGSHDSENFGSFHFLTSFCTFIRS
jgi:hypothetical protein